MYKKLISIISVCLALTLVVTGCSTKNKEDVIDKVTESNVEQVTAEYKLMLSFFQELKGDVEKLSQLRQQQPDGKNENEDIKNNLVTNRDELESSAVKYVDLMDAKQQLLKAFRVVEDASDNVYNDRDVFDKDMEEYKTIFNDFNKLMTATRVKIEAIRGEKADDMNKEPSDKKEDPSKKDKETQNEKDKEKEKNSAAEEEKQKNTQDNGNNGPAVKKESKLDDSLKKDIYNAGYSSGQDYKASGQSGNLEAEAAQIFDGLEGDSPIEKDNVPEAKRIFIKAFIEGYNAG